MYSDNAPPRWPTICHHLGPADTAAHSDTYQRVTPTDELTGVAFSTPVRRSPCSDVLRIDDEVLLYNQNSTRSVATAWAQRTERMSNRPNPVQKLLEMYVVEYSEHSDAERFIYDAMTKLAIRTGSTWNQLAQNHRARLTDRHLSSRDDGINLLSRAAISTVISESRR